MRQIDIFKKERALVILSGGQDSTTCLFWALHYFNEVHAVTFNYGQKHSIEIVSAKKVATLADVASHEIIEIPNLLKSTSPLVDKNATLEQYQNAEEMGDIIGDRIEKTFVPMRNMLFFTIAMNRAVELGCQNLISGICQEDNANYPDCTNQFKVSYFTAVNESLGINPHHGHKAHTMLTPLMNLSKSETVLLAKQLPGCWDALAYTHTSYDGKYPPTDKNHANVLRAEGFEKAGLPDPLVLRAMMEGLMSIPMTPNYDRFRVSMEV